MSLLPTILSVLRELPDVDDGPRRSPYSPAVMDLLSDLVQLLDNGHPSSLGGLPRQRRQLSAPLRHHINARKGAVGDQGASGFAVDVNVKNFRPEELSVQVLKDQGLVVVEGKHEERADEHGFVRRQFTRRYKLPDGVDPDTVTSRMSSDGVLQVTAPRKEALPAPVGNVRQVSITLAPSNQPTSLDKPHVADENAAAKSKPEAAGDEKKMKNAGDGGVP